MLCNPHNPLGRCYSKGILEDCARFCQSRAIHLISDEVFALSGFKSPDLPDAPQFTSLLSLDLTSLGCDPERVHVVWSMSKDLAASGVRLVGPIPKIAKIFLCSDESESRDAWSLRTKISETPWL